MVPPITDPSLSQVHSLLQAGPTSFKNNMESLAGTRPQPFPSPCMRFLGNASFSVTIVSAVGQKEETHVFCLTRMSSFLLGQVHGAVQVQDDIPIRWLLLRQPVFYLVFIFRTGLTKALILAPKPLWRRPNHVTTSVWATCAPCRCKRLLKSWSGKLLGTR